MKTRFLVLLLSIFTQPIYSQTLKAFKKETAQLGLQFIMPAGYQIKKILPNRDLQYSFAIINSDSTMEIRYSLFPLKPIIKKYELAKKSKRIMINPDSIYVELMKGNGKSMTNGTIPEIEEMPLKTAHNFNADYVGTYTFDFMCEFGRGYKHGQFVCLHKKNIADVIITFMSNDLNAYKDLIETAFYALTFK